MCCVYSKLFISLHHGTEGSGTSERPQVLGLLICLKVCINQFQHDDTVLIVFSYNFKIRFFLQERTFYIYDVMYHFFFSYSITEFSSKHIQT